MIQLKSFTQFLNEAVYTHSTHLEDVMFEGKSGVANAIKGLEFIKNKFGVADVSNNSIIHTKTDGCVHENTKVITNNGIKSIKDITQNDAVLCLDLKTQKFEYEPNSYPRITGYDKNWVEVCFTNGHSLFCTEDHPILMEDMTYIEASKSEGKSIYTIDGMNFHVKKVIPLKQKFAQWDLTTHCENFVILLENKAIVVHNSPAVYCGWLNNNFFVATKSLFAKTPKINFSDKDIDTNHSGDLASKLKNALKYLKPIVPKNSIYQGDFLFDTSDRKTETINGVKHYTWHPNTIKYAVEVDSEIGKKIGSAKMGIVFHTKYKSDGVNVSSIQLDNFNVSKNIFKASKDVYVSDPYQRNIGSIASFSKEQSEEFEAYKKFALSNVDKIDWNFIQLHKEKLMIFLNSMIKSNQKMIDPKAMSKAYEEYVISGMNKEIATKKTEKGIQSAKEKWLPYLKISPTLDIFFETYTAIADMKYLVIKKIDSIQQTKTFVLKRSGDLEVTTDEGYVIAQGDLNSVKLVDRYRFSANNFSKDVIHGFEVEGR